MKKYEADFTPPELPTVLSASCVCRVDELMQISAMTARQAAHKLGVSAMEVGRWLAGQKPSKTHQSAIDELLAEYEELARSDPEEHQFRVQQAVK